PCGAESETQLHILTECPFYWSRKGFPLSQIGSVMGILNEHPSTFSFEGPESIPLEQRTMPPDFLNRKKGRHKSSGDSHRSREDRAYANNLEYQCELAWMREAQKQDLGPATTTLPFANAPIPVPWNHSPPPLQRSPHRSRVQRHRRNDDAVWARNLDYQRDLAAMQEAQELGQGPATTTPPSVNAPIPVPWF